MGNAMGACSLVDWTSMAMNASSYFTNQEIEIAMGLILDILNDKNFINDISISNDASNKYYKLIDRINIYFNNN